MSDSQELFALPWLIPRPRRLIEHLPLQYQWEFTRRHAYYVMFWNVSEWDRFCAQLDLPLAEPLKDIARIILAQIGVGDSEIPPERSWDDIAPDDQWSAWTTGAVSRVSIRDLAAQCSGNLSKDTLRSLSCLFWKAAELDDQDLHGQYRLAKDIIDGEFPGFDEYLPDVLVSLKPSSTKDTITKAAMEILRSVREEAGLESSRSRTDKFDTYLRVWDLREGWANGAYDRSRIRKLKEIAVDTGLKLTTVRDHYKAAFRLITGLEYSPEDWFRVLGHFQSRGLVGSPEGPAPRRIGRTRSVAGISESELTENGDVLSTFAGASASSILFEDDCGEVLDAILSDRPTTEIVSEFELSPEAAGLIDDYRERLADGA